MTTRNLFFCISVLALTPALLADVAKIESDAATAEGDGNLRRSISLYRDAAKLRAASLAKLEATEKKRKKGAGIDLDGDLTYGEDAADPLGDDLGVTQKMDARLALQAAAQISELQVITGYDYLHAAETNVAERLFAAAEKTTREALKLAKEQKNATLAEAARKRLLQIRGYKRDYTPPADVPAAEAAQVWMDEIWVLRLREDFAAALAAGEKAIDAGAGVKAVKAMLAARDNLPGRDETFAWLRKMANDARFKDDEKVAIWNLTGDYASTRLRPEILHEAANEIKKLGGQPNWASILKEFEAAERFPRPESEIVFPKTLADFGVKREGKTVRAENYLDLDDDGSDMTKAIQDALDTPGVQTVVIGKLKTPWRIRSVKVHSNQRVQIEKGVQILGERLSRSMEGVDNCSLFEVKKVRNVIIEGLGDRPEDCFVGKYATHAERKANGRRYYGGCGVGIDASANVLVRNLKVSYNTCDGVSVGGLLSPAQNIWLDNLVCDGNFRQGMSIVNADGVYSRKVVFSGTDGNEPKAGVDMEPVYPSNFISEIYFLDCRFYNNASKNVIFATSTYAPMTAYFKRCQFEAQRNGNIAVLARAGIYMEAFCHAPSKIIFDECRIDGYSDGYGNPIQFLSTFLYDVTFRNCVINDRGCLLKGEKETASPIHLILDRAVYDGFYPNAGVVTFDNVKVNGYDNVPLVQVTDKNGKYGINTFRGTIDWNGKPVDMSKFSFLSPERGRGDSPEPDLVKLKLPDGLATPWTPSFAFYFQHAYYMPRPKYVYYCRGERGREAVFRLDYTCDLVAKQPPVRVIAPDGAVTPLGSPKRGENEFRYVFPSDGLFTFDFNQECDMSRDWSAPEGYRLLAAKGVRPAYQSLQTPEGRFVQITLGKTFPGYMGYFEVPAGRECMIKMMGGGGLEIRNARGELVCSHRATCDYDGAKCLVFKSDSAENEIWSFTVLDRWGRFHFFDPLPGIWADDPADLPTVAGGKLAFCQKASEAILNGLEKRIADRIGICVDRESDDLLFVLNLDNSSL